MHLSLRQGYVPRHVVHLHVLTEACAGKSMLGKFGY